MKSPRLKTFCYLIYLSLQFLIDSISVYTGDLLLLLSHVQCGAPTEKTGLSGRWRCGRWVAGNGWKKTRTTGQTTSRIRLSLQHPPSVPHNGEQPNIQDQAVNCVNSRKSQGDCYCEQAKVRSHYLKEGTNQPIPTQLLRFGNGDWLYSIGGVSTNCTLYC